MSRCSLTEWAGDGCRATAPLRRTGLCKTAPVSAHCALLEAENVSHTEPQISVYLSDTLWSMTGHMPVDATIHFQTPGGLTYDLAKLYSLTTTACCVMFDLRHEMLAFWGFVSRFEIQEQK